MKRPPDSQPPQTRSQQDWPIQQLPGLNATDQALLQTIGIRTTLQLHHQTRTLADQQRLASQLEIHLQHVSKWAALADLAQIPSVGCRYCGLLLHAGIASPAQLSQTPLSRLHRQILRLQVATLQRQDLCPSLSKMQLWIEQARQIAVQKPRSHPSTASRSASPKSAESIAKLARQS
jgi:hypothetical protein